MNASQTVPVLLLKTRSQPHDAYEEYLAPSSGTGGSGSGSGSTKHADSAVSTVLLPEFVPVLDHRANTENLARLEDLLKRGRLSEQYGGMIFTSQRAVEAWADVVKRVEQQQGARVEEHGSVSASNPDAGHRYGVFPPTPAPAYGGERKNCPSGDVDVLTLDKTTAIDHDGGNPSGNLFDDDFAFPLYTVGPATSRALNTLVTESSASKQSPFSRLRPSVLGEHTGNGDTLAQYILWHYNALHSRRLYTFYDAPRLPFTPVMGPARGERVDKDDVRLQKKPLLFLVGEQRRDIIPKTLTDKEGKLAPGERIQVDEVEVYTTVVMESFQDDFRRRIASSREHGAKVVVVVVFSPQGCESMLRSLDYIDQGHALTERAKTRWAENVEGHDVDAAAAPSQTQPPRYVIVTIGPTTRDHLRSKYGFDPDVCAAKPSPEGVGKGLMEFLEKKGLIL
ncbi:hypothetical protein AYL99_07614 [Fonsecaea erecta]|uniref:Tetrapyrrole biosynthesis uroporphyrinogen III synthase domain-containing protein n=1 Tax=Fonsecaea erecta TaxID=1367422 RepID=A0A178ZFG4_9EURO|nr:hypothetical protein AYL99_07614 [Fonsecaea erecta]OAP58524.1 hypothetical protein AYL99_07614 [Fonsecaea erecta]